MMANIKLTAVYEEQKDGSYVDYVEEIAGVNTQGETLDEAKSNLKKALKMMLGVKQELKIK
jgi:predicted RNase H-like HicB family nuclease